MTQDEYQQHNHVGSRIEAYLGMFTILTINYVGIEEISFGQMALSLDGVELLAILAVTNGGTVA